MHFQKLKLFVAFVLVLLVLSLFATLITRVWGSDTTPPTYKVASPLYTSTGNWTSTIISAQFNDNVNISKVFVRQNVTGTWSANVTLIPTWTNHTSCWANYTMLLPKTVGTVIGFRWLANDTSNNWVTTEIYTLTTTLVPVTYSQNAVWIQDAAWSWFATKMDNILTNNLTGLVSDLKNNNIKYAMVFVGYWDAVTPSSPTISYQHSASFYQNVINTFHSAGIKVLAWAEDGGGGTMDLTSGNRQNIYNAIVSCMKIGFDGYNDDVERLTGTTQDDINYLNNATTVLHSMGKLMTADISYDYQQEVNMYLHMDYILSMFYGGAYHITYSSSTFEDPQGPAYWEEDFGLYGVDHGAPASPMIIGIMNYYENEYPLCWQLNMASKFMSTYTHRNMVGFCFWLYESMGTRGDDWAQWNYFDTEMALGASPQLYNVTFTSSPITHIDMVFQGNTQEYIGGGAVEQVSTPISAFTFSVPLTISTPTTVSGYNFANWEDSSTSATRTISSVASNSTFTAYYVSGVKGYWYFIFNPEDMNNNAVSGITWQLFNGTQPLNYMQGQYSLTAGTYTLKTYYGGSLINSTSLSTATQGNTTITIRLPIEPQSAGGYVAFNTTITSFTWITQTSANRTFQATGSGATKIIVASNQNATLVKRNGVIQTGWKYMSGYIVLNTTGLSTWEFDFSIPVGISANTWWGGLWLAISLLSGGVLVVVARKVERLKRPVEKHKWDLATFFIVMFTIGVGIIWL